MGGPANDGSKENDTQESQRVNQGTAACRGRRSVSYEAETQASENIGSI